MGNTYRFGWYLAALQLFFALRWTVYVIYLPKLAATAGIAPKWEILIRNGKSLSGHCSSCAGAPFNGPL